MKIQSHLSRLRDLTGLQRARPGSLKRVPRDPRPRAPGCSGKDTRDGRELGDHVERGAPRHLPGGHVGQDEPQLLEQVRELEAEEREVRERGRRRAPSRGAHLPCVPRARRPPRAPRTRRRGGPGASRGPWPRPGHVSRLADAVPPFAVPRETPPSRSPLLRAGPCGGQ